MNIEQLIRSHITLGRPSATGFHPLKCPICNDHTPRMGIKFDNGEIGANCFNCGFVVKHVENSDKMSEKFRRLLKELLIPDDAVENALGQAFFKKAAEPTTITMESLKKVSLHTPEVVLPPNCYLLGSPGLHEEDQDAAYEYILSRRLESHTGPLYLSTSERYRNRIIIPFYRSGKLIYWQARSIDGAEPRYLNCEVPKEAILYGYDELNTFSMSPLWVVEGVMDAMSINGVAMIGSKLNDAKIEIFRKTRRDLIFVIDQDDNGLTLGKKVLDEGWKITFTEKGTDVNKSVQEYGKLWTIYSLVKNIPSSKFEAEVMLKLKCQKKTKKITQRK